MTLDIKDQMNEISQTWHEGFKAGYAKGFLDRNENNQAVLLELRKEIEDLLRMINHRLSHSYS